MHRLFASYFRPARHRRRRLFPFPARVRRVPNVLGAFPPISRPFQDDYYGLLLIIAAIVIYTVLPMCCLYLYFHYFYTRFPPSLLVYIRFRHYYASGRRPPSSEPFRGFNQVCICLVLGLSFSLDNMSFFLSAPPSLSPFLLFPYLDLEIADFGFSRSHLPFLH